MKFSSVSAFFITIILFSLFSSTALAVIDVNTYTPSMDFTLTSAYDKISVCSCSTKYDSIIVTNSGTWPAIFTVSTSKIDSTLTLSQNSFELNPGQTQEVFLYITADCNRGSENLKITVTSNLGPQKTLTKEITRDRCQNIEMWTSNYTKDVKPCQSKTFDINVHNIGPFSENYVISSNYDKYITYNANSFSLDEGQYAKITATAKFDCDMYGEKDIIFTIKSLKNDLAASLDAPLNILQDYDYTIDINGDDSDGNFDIQVCNRISSKTIPVNVMNDGSVPNTYTVEFDGLPRNVKVSGLTDGKFSLNPKESKTFYLEIDSTNYRYEHKLKDFTMTVVPGYGDIVKKSQVSLEFMACYEHQVVIYDGEKTKNHPLETCANYDYAYDVEIINNGAFTETYRLSLEGAPEGTILSRESITITPSAGRDTVKLLINGPESNELYNVKVVARLDNGISESDDTWIRSYDTQTCHETSIGKSDHRINYQTQSITIPIKNKGFVDNTYIVSWDGSGIIDDDDTIINLASQSKDDIVLKIDSEDRKEGTYNGTLVLKDASQAEYSKDVQIELKDKSDIRKFFEYMTSGNSCKKISLLEIVAILIIILIIIIFLVKGPHYPYNFGNRFKAKMSVLVFLIMLFLIGVILVMMIAGIPKEHTEVYNLTNSDSELRYEWLQDDKFMLDISRFFYDPENTTLKYEVSGLEHINAVSNGDVITFYPEKGWNGTEYGRITAYDKMGGSVSSPKFEFTVLNVPEKTKLELYNIYCWYVNLAIFAIILALIFVAVFVKQKRRTRK